MSIDFICLKMFIKLNFSLKKYFKYSNLIFNYNNIYVSQKYNKAFAQKFINTNTEDFIRNLSILIQIKMGTLTTYFSQNRIIKL